MWVRDSAHKWVVTVPAEFTKTDIPYSWLVEPEEEWLLKAIKKTPNCGYNNPTVMNSNVARFFKDNVMAQVPAKKPNGDEMPQTLRSIRARMAKK